MQGSDGSIAFVGAGRVALALALALHRQGLAVQAVGGRERVSAQRLVQALASHTALQTTPQTALPLPRAVTAQAAVDEAELVFLTVPDDAIAAVCARLRWRAGQCVVHCSGATGLEVLASAQAAGALVGGFHPLQIFSDPVLGAARLSGCSVAIEAPPALSLRLRGLATALGLHTIDLPPGARARYHAAAGYAASSLLPLLQEAVALWQSFGQDEAACLRALLPLARGTLDAVQARGVSGALSGPISRGDAAVLAIQRAALATLGPDHEALFCQLGTRQLAMAQALGRVSTQQLQALQNVLNCDAGVTRPTPPLD